LSDTNRNHMKSIIVSVLFAFLIILLNGCGNNCRTPKETLDAFVAMDKGLNDALVQIEQQNEMIYQEFEKQYQLSKKKVEKWKKLADAVKLKSEKLSNGINDIKVKIIKEADENMSLFLKDGIMKVDAIKIASKDNIDFPKKVLFDDAAGSLLRKKMENYHEFLEKILLDNKADEEIIQKIKLLLNTGNHISEDGEEITWEEYLFEGMPLISVIAMLTKIQLDVRIAENLVTLFFMRQISGDDHFSFKLEALVLSKATEIIEGSDYQAEIFPAVFDTLVRPDIYIGDYNPETFELGKNAIKINILNNGRGRYIIKDPSLGEHTYKGFIKLSTPLVDKYYPFEGKYRVLPRK